MQIDVCYCGEIGKSPKLSRGPKPPKAWFRAWFRQPSRCFLLADLFQTSYKTVAKPVERADGVTRPHVAAHAKRFNLGVGVERGYAAAISDR